jgi:AraC-like DNA-binding protein
VRLRQTRDRERLTRFRVVAPGEVEHEIDLGQLAPLPPPDWSAALLAACTSLYDRWVETAAGGGSRTRPSATCRGGCSSSTRSGSATYSSEARADIERNFADALPLARLGRRAGVSSFALLRMFQAAIGLSPRSYQTLLRVAHAKRVLREGRSIARAAVECGFYDQSHLTCHFRRVVGLTPGGYLRAQESPI